MILLIDGDLDAACEDALGQIEDNHYIEVLEEDGVEKILKYGIAFYKRNYINDKRNSTEKNGKFDWRVHILQKKRKK